MRQEAGTKKLSFQLWVKNIQDFFQKCCFHTGISSQSFQEVLLTENSAKRVFIKIRDTNGADKDHHSGQQQKGK